MNAETISSSTNPDLVVEFVEFTEMLGHPDLVAPRKQQLGPYETVELFGNQSAVTAAAAGDGPAGACDATAAPAAPPAGRPDSLRLAANADGPTLFEISVMVADIAEQFVSDEIAATIGARVAKALLDAMGPPQ